MSKYQQRISSGSVDDEDKLSAKEVKLHIIYPDELAIEDSSSEEEDDDYVNPKSDAFTRNKNR